MRLLEHIIVKNLKLASLSKKDLLNIVDVTKTNLELSLESLEKSGIVERKSLYNNKNEIYRLREF